MTTARRRAEVAREWLGEGRRVVAALLVEIEGSAPLEPGATMLIASDGAIEGSITGGCVEAAVVEEAAQVLAGGPPRVVTYGISDELAGTVGLTCGGTVHVLVNELEGEAARVEALAMEAVAAGRPVAVATLLEGERAGAKLATIEGEAVGSLGGPELLDHTVARDAAGMLAQGRTGVRRYGADGATLGAEVAVHVHAYAAPPQMLIFGAVDFSVALARLARELGYAVTIADPREPFVRTPRFETAASVRVAWPQDAFEGLDLGPRDAVLVFTHDPKLDEPALRGALETGAGYIGALGSRRTTADRNRRLVEAGVPESSLARVHAPCGLDVGAGTPEEVAVSVLAEIVAARSRRGGEPLRETSGAIHARPAPTRRLATIVLAAGAGSRFGAIKQLAEVEGEPLLARVLDALDGLGDEQVVVLGAGAEQIAGQPFLAGWRVTVAEDWAAGPGASVRAGLRAVPDADAALIVLGDLAWLQRTAAERVIAAAAEDPAGEAARAFDGAVPGHPVLVRGALLERARSAPDAGLGPLLGGVALPVDCAGLGVAEDVDTPADLLRR